jgi:tetratricopeptide (TPR) repeat protein
MKKSIIFTLALVVVTLFAMPVPVVASETIESLQKNWALAKYKTEGKQRKKAFNALTAQADKAVSAAPDSPEVHIWAGIIYSTNAGEVSMFSAGKQVKRARAELDRALELNPAAMSGAAYTSLGALLFQIPGFLGGDDEEAENMLKKGVALNVDGIDANYFYGIFLLDQDRLDESETYLNTALKAQDRPGRPIADNGRRGEINEALMEIKEKRS